VAVSSASAPLDAAIVARVRASFARQGAMATLGADLADVAAGRVAIAVPIESRLSQQDGFLHAGSSSPRSTAPGVTRR
jgi:acyl-coenzyme A thioesterase PaaI-like protein